MLYNSPAEGKYQFPLAQIEPISQVIGAYKLVLIAASAGRVLVVMYDNIFLVLFLP